jgi:hypothetical protein
MLSASAAWAQNSCLACHSALEGPLGAPVKQFELDVHRQNGLGCADCHGGNPAEASLGAMSPAKGFRGVPKKPQIPEFCARCHSDGAYMRRFNPSLRTDQLAEYLTSAHGKRLKQGDSKVAACVDCHTAHQIMPPSDPRSSVYPANVAATCGRCHSDPAYVKGYSIPTDQVAQYQKSVHAETLAKGDVSAPTCNTCHGSHGATPPGVTSVANVCGTCHVFVEQLFKQSPHQPVFARLGLPGCVQCHSNHAVLRPSDDWVGTGQKSICLTCHASGDGGHVAAGKIAADLNRLKTSYARADDILARAERSGMEVSSARLELTSANQSLVQARVNVHTLDDAQVRKLTDEGVQVATKSYDAGAAALRERDFRRKGLGLSLVFVVLAIIGIYLKIRQMNARTLAGK